MSEQQHLYTPSHESLLRCEPAALLEAYADKFNQLIDNNDGLNTALKMSQQQHDGVKRLLETKKTEITELTQLNETLNAENQQCRQMALEAEKIANKSIAVQRERDLLKAQVKQLQQEVTKMKSGDSPERLKKQINRLKEKNADLVKRDQSRQSDIAAYRKDKQQAQIELNKAINVIRDLKKELAHNTGAGIYHKGDDHLIIHPQNLTMQREDGSIFQGRGLMYMHQSGRGGLMTFDPETGTHLCAEPKGGVIPSDDTLEFANNWLYKVNEVQDGVVHENDLTAIDYNTNQQAA